MKTPLLDHLEKLKYFVMVAESKSIHEAARTLRLSQPTLTRSIRILEEALGQKLFLRSVEGSRLTSEGKKLLSVGKEILQETRRFERDLVGETAQKRELTTVGTYLSLANDLFIPCLKKLGTAHRYEVFVSTKNDLLIEKCVSGELNLIVIAEAPSVRHLQRVKLITTGLKFYVSPNHALAKRKKVSIKELEAFPSVVSPGSLLGQNATLDAVLWEMRLTGGITYSVNSFSICLAWACEGLAFTVLPEVVAKSALAERKLCEVNVVGLPKDFGLSTIYALYPDSAEEKTRLLLKELIVTARH